MLLCDMRRIKRPDKDAFLLRFFGQDSWLAAALTKAGDTRRDRTDVAVVIEFVHFAVFDGAQVSGELEGFVLHLAGEQQHFRNEIRIEEERFGLRISLQFVTRAGVGFKNEVCAGAGNWRDAPLEANDAIGHRGSARRKEEAHKYHV